MCLTSIIITVVATILILVVAVQFYKQGYIDAKLEDINNDDRWLNI